MGDAIQSSGLFSIFVISIFSLVLFPYTIYRLCASDDNEGPAQPWAKNKKKSRLASLASRMTSKGNLALIGLWLLWGLMLLWVQASVKDMKPFDPFEILGVEASATDKEIKKAYRQLTLQYHPDKNPDPSAQSYYAEFIQKAYQALTDEVSRQNYEKYGHPDGPQAVNVGVALPDWMFAREKGAAPLMLLALVGGGILLPLVAVSYYMMNQHKFAGPNHIMQETLAFYMHSKYNVKESQSLVRVPETLVCCMEFITLATPAEQAGPLDELRRAVLRCEPDLKDKAAFWKRKASVLKAHMLLLGYMERDNVDIPAALQQDLKFVLQKSPLLLEEMFKIASIPRPPHGHGWLTPAVAVLEMQQCLAQAMSVADRRPAGNRPADASAAALLQLPGVDADVVKKLKRRKVTTLKELLELPEAERGEALRSCGVKDAALETIGQLLSALPTVQLRVSFEMEGEDDIMEGDVAKCKVRIMLTRPSHSSPQYEPPAKGKPIRAYTPLFPHPHDENWYFLLADPGTNALLGCSPKVSLSEAEAVGYARPELAQEWAASVAAAASGTQQGSSNNTFVASSGTAALAAAGSNSTAAGSNSTAAAAAAVAATAAAGGAQGAAAANGALVPSKGTGRAAATANKFIRSYGSAGGLADESLLAAPADQAGQLVEIPFLAPLKAGRYELQLIAMCDSYVGCDRVLPVRLRVSAATRAAQEVREARQAAKSGSKKAPAWSDNDDEEEEESSNRRGRRKAIKDAGSQAGSGDEGSDGGSDDDDEDDDDGSDYDYDSDETGELESDDEDDEDEVPSSKAKRSGRAAKQLPAVGGVDDDSKEQ